MTTKAACGGWKLDFCKMDIGPIFFQEISFFDFLEESTQILIWAVVKI